MSVISDQHMASDQYAASNLDPVNGSDVDVPVDTDIVGDLNRRLEMFAAVLIPSLHPQSGTGDEVPTDAEVLRIPEVNRVADPAGWGRRLDGSPEGPGG